jgi:hypothetical protein
MICLNILGEIIYESLEWGLSSRSVYYGGSVARAREAKVSIIKLIQSSWSGVNNSYLTTAAPTKVHETATTFTVN